MSSVDARDDSSGGEKISGVEEQGKDSDDDDAYVYHIIWSPRHMQGAGPIMDGKSTVGRLSIDFSAPFPITVVTGVAFFSVAFESAFLVNVDVFDDDDGFEVADLAYGDDAHEEFRMSLPLSFPFGTHPLFCDCTCFRIHPRVPCSCPRWKRAHSGTSPPSAKVRRP